MEKKLLFKAKTQPANSSSGHGGDKWHNMEVDGRIYNGETKIVDLVREHLQTKEKKNQNGRGMVGSGK